MTAAAKEAFALDVRGADGFSLRDTLESVARQTGVRPARLDTSDIPVEFFWYWKTWVELSAGRTYGSFGAAPLSWRDLSAWSSLSRIRLTLTDVEIIRAIDSAWFETQAEGREKREAASNVAEKRGRRR